MGDIEDILYEHCLGLLVGLMPLEHEYGGLVVDPTFLPNTFMYHHVEQGYAMLTFWLPDGPSTLPSTSLHEIGVGAFVLNENREVLGERVDMSITLFRHLEGPYWFY